MPEGPTAANPIAEMSTMARDFYQEEVASIDTDGDLLSEYITGYSTLKAKGILGWKIHALDGDGSNRLAMFYGNVDSAGAADTVKGRVAAGIALLSSDLPVRLPEKIWVKGNGAPATKVVIDVYTLHELD